MYRKSAKRLEMTSHAKTCKRNSQYLQESGYVILIDDWNGRGLKPDILAVDPKTKHIIWVEVLNRSISGKAALSEEKRLAHIRCLLKKADGVLVTIFDDYRGMIDMGNLEV